MDLPKKGEGLGQSANLREGAWQERGSVVFLRVGGGGVDTLMHTVIYIIYTYYIYYFNCYLAVTRRFIMSLGP